MASERLDKVLAGLGAGSRREIAALARAGKITVNGEICRAPDRKISPEEDKLSVDGQPFQYRAHWYLMLNKPAGVVTATEDNFQRTVLDLLPEQLRRAGVFPVGRLDKDTEGLLLLTTDGAFGHALMSPRRHVPKVYEARFGGTLAPDAAARFAAGLTLADGTLCRAAVLEPIGADSARVTLCEGKFHQVKRMLRAVGVTVTALRRIRIGALALDPALAPGAFRELREDERAALRTALEAPEKGKDG